VNIDCYKVLLYDEYATTLTLSTKIYKYKIEETARYINWITAPVLCLVQTAALFLISLKKF